MKRLEGNAGQMRFIREVQKQNTRALNEEIPILEIFKIYKWKNLKSKHLYDQPLD